MGAALRSCWLMRSRFVGASGGVINQDSCRGDGGPRTVHAGPVGETVIVPIVDDSYLDGSNPDTNRGAQNWLRVSKAAANWNKGVWWADLSAYAGRTVISANLWLYCYTGGNHIFDFYGITAEWVELQVTWNDRKTGVPWGVAGGDYDVLSFTSKFIAATAQFYAVDVKTIVEDWLDATRVNYGILSWCAGAGNLLGIWTAEVGTVEWRPYFELVLVPL